MQGTPQTVNLQALQVAFSSAAPPAEQVGGDSTAGLRLEVEAPLPRFVANSVAAQAVQSRDKRQPIPAQQAIEEVQVLTCITTTLASNVQTTHVL